MTLVLEWELHPATSGDASMLGLGQLAKLRLAEDIADGLAFLPSKKIIHKCIKSLNIQVDVDLRAKVADFGSSKSLSSG